MKLSRRYIIIFSALLLVLVASGAVWLAGGRGPSAPDFSNKTPEQISEYLQSEEFRNLDPNTRRAAAREAMGQMMIAQARQYFELPPEEQVAYLDRVMDDMQSRRRERGSMRRGFGGGRGGRDSRRAGSDARREGSGSGPRLADASGGEQRFRPDGRDGRRGRRRGRRRSPERMRARTEFRDPKTRAQVAKFRQALRERMRERGVDFRPPRR